MGNVSERLKQLREARTGNQSGVARAVGMSQTTYSDWEASPPRALDYLRRLAEHFHVSADYLLGLTNDPRPADERGAGWDEVVVQIAQDVMFLPPDRRINVQMAVGAIVEREKAVRRAAELEALANQYEEALQSAATFIAGSKLVGVEQLAALRDEMDRLLGAHSTRVVKTLTQQSDG